VTKFSMLRITLSAKALLSFFASPSDVTITFWLVAMRTGGTPARGGWRSDVDPSPAHTALIQRLFPLSLNDETSAYGADEQRYLLHTAEASAQRAPIRGYFESGDTNVESRPTWKGLSRWDVLTSSPIQAVGTSATRSGTGSSSRRRPPRVFCKGFSSRGRC